MPLPPCVAFVLPPRRFCTNMVAYPPPACSIATAFCDACESMCVQRLEVRLCFREPCTPQLAMAVHCAEALLQKAACSAAIVRTARFASCR